MIRTPEGSCGCLLRPEKSRCSFCILIQLSHGCSFDAILTEASKDWLILERIIEVASTAVGEIGNRLGDDPGDHQESIDP